ncbi:MAG TPA: anti-sigma factor [Thermoanaerobaculia bacterium]|nr:anti-sigma factor [Thermoanaerobaculia bacterium]
MNCLEVIGFIMEYLDGVLAPRQRSEFEKHLEICDSCVAYLRTYEQTIKMEVATRIEDVTIPEDLVRAILASRRM